MEKKQCLGAQSLQHCDAPQITQEVGKHPIHTRPADHSCLHRRPLSGIHAAQAANVAQPIGQTSEISADGFVARCCAVKAKAHWRWGCGTEALVPLWRSTIGTTTLHDHIDDAFALWEARSAADWTPDLSMLTAVGISASKPPTAQKRRDAAAQILSSNDNLYLGAEPTPTPEELPPAGWYDDPTGENRWRWWDGSTWTVHVG